MKGAVRTLLVAAVFLEFIACTAAQCTKEDYTGTYTQCIGNTRHLIWFWKPNVNCTGGEPLPHNVFNLPCDIACGEGKYLPLGETQCQECSPGTFSIGGGVRIDSFPEDWTLVPGIQIETYCTDLDNVKKTDCTGWYGSDGGLTLISGNTTHSRKSVLEVDVQLLTAGHVHFIYKVDAEPHYDGLIFYINDVVVMDLVSVAPEFINFEKELPKGFYEMKWVYKKDYSVTRGKDVATLNMIEIGGINYVDSECTDCPPGQYSNETGQEMCLDCPQDTFNDKPGNSICESCASNSFSYPGSSACNPRVPCTVEDYYEFYTECVAPGVRTKSYDYLQPLICDYHSFTLPPTQTDLPCARCNPGTLLSNVDYQCHPCEPGSYGDGESCSPCGTGHAAVPGLFFSRWDVFPSEMTTGCTGNCGSSGWRVQGDKIDSGAGHGANVDSYLEIHVTVEGSGLLEFEFSVECDSFCWMDFIDSEYSANTYNQATNLRKTFHLAAGNHSLRWVFTKLDPFLTGRNDRAFITSLNITGNTNGGAAQCVPCTAGTYSSASHTQCALCPAGESSNPQSDSCHKCPPNTFNEEVGGICIPCGLGTTSEEGATECTTDCAVQFTHPSGNVSYDLSPLSSSDDMYGPIRDTHDHTYYLNVCSKEHRNHTCFDDEGNAVSSFACQITAQGLGLDLGHALSFAEYTADPTNGVVLKYTLGSSFACAVHQGDPEFPRETTVTFQCDPEQGVGMPEGTVPLEASMCKYGFIWKSLYGCPLCSSNDYTFEYSACLGDQQTKHYYWKQNPKRCHGGVSLPEDEPLSCSQPTFACEPGQVAYPGVNTCQNCEKGKFSIGGGITYSDWNTMPIGFESGCSSAPCKTWQTTGTTFQSDGDQGPSWLQYTGYWVQPGSFSFTFMASTSALHPLHLFVDNQLIQSFTTSQLTPLMLNYTVSAGAHQIKWYLPAPMHSRAAISYFQVKGTSLAATTCTKCPAGTASEMDGSSECTICPANTYSSEGSIDCTPCEPNEFSIAGSSFCKPRLACTAEDYKVMYTPCSGGTRTQYYVPHEPKICTGSVSLPNTTVDCAACPPGSYNSGDSCFVCGEGKIYIASQGTCVNVTPGSRTMKLMQYLTGFTTELPDEFSTGCSGPCAAQGWIVNDRAFAVGNDTFDVSKELDNFLSLQVHVGPQGGSVSYDFSYFDQQSHLEIFLDGQLIKPQESVGRQEQGNSLIELPAGQHVVTWNHHQLAGSRSVATLRNIVVVDSVVNTGIVSVDCPEGSYSDHSGSTSCTKCSAGFFAQTVASTHCSACSVGSFSREVGSSQCFPCGTGTTSPSNSTQCRPSLYTDECLFNTTDFKPAESTGYQFNLGPPDAFTRATWNVPVPQGIFHVAMCDMLDASVCKNAQNQSIQSSVCFVDQSGVGKNYGDLMSFSSASNSTEGFQILYSTSASVEGCTAPLTTKITFKCDSSVDKGVLEIDPANHGPCNAALVFASIWSCPVCTTSDFSETHGACEAGQRPVFRSRSGLCNAPELEVIRQEECSNATVEFPVIGIVGLTVAFLLVVLVAVVYFVKHRQMQYKYSRLVNGEDRATELGTISEEGGTAYTREHQNVALDAEKFSIDEKD